MSVEINATNFPDQYFRQYVYQYFDKDRDYVLSDAEIAQAKTLKNSTDSSSYQYLLTQAASLQGIEYLTALETINLYQNPNLTELDVSRNTHLRDLHAQAGALEVINASDNPELELLYCNRNPLQTLLLDNNPALKEISAFTTPSIAAQGTISSLNLSRCVNLEYANIDFQDAMTEIDVSKCSKLRYLSFRATQITKINIANNPRLLLAYHNGQRVIGGSGDDSYSYYQLKSGSEDTIEGLLIPKLRSAAGYAKVIDDAIVISQQPASTSVLSGDTAEFSVEADGSDLTYSWEVKLAGTDVWIVQENETSDSLSLTASSELDQAAVRCHITANYDGASHDKYTDSATLTVIFTPVVETSPSDTTLEVGESCSLEVEAIGNSLTYQWQVSEDGGESYSDLSGQTAAILVLTAEAGMNGNYYRCKITNAAGMTYSSAAEITVTEDIRTVSPAELSLVEGQSGTFSVNAKSSDISYQWQYSADGLTWADLRNSDAPRYEILASMSLNGYRYRCVVTNSVGSVTSSAGTLTVVEDTSVTAPVISVNPVNVTVDEGQTATFTVAAEGDDLSYQWQVQKDGGWQSVQGATGTSYSVVGTRQLNGSKYRCLVANAAGAVYSLDAILTVNQQSYISTPRILTQPRSATVALGDTVSFIVRADGGELSYQWQRLNGGQWYDLTGQTASACILTATSDLDGTQYRCAVSNTAGTTYTNIVLLSLTEGPIVDFYGYHSIIISGKNTYGEWEMYPTSRPHIAPPEVKTSYVDLPGADGGIDYTDLLTGEPRYGYRKGSWEFLLIPQDKWASVYRSLVSFLHGKVHTVILEDDPNYVYTGRLSVNEWQSAAHNSLITIDYILEPFPKNISGEDPSESDEEVLNAAERLLRRPENAGMVIGIVNNTASIIDPAILFPDGDSIAY